MVYCRYSPYLSQADALTKTDLLFLLQTPLRHVPASERSRKQALLDQLAALQVLNRKTVWEFGDYHFDFQDSRYYWKHSEVVFTAGEQLCLYKWLCLNERISSLNQFMRNIRRRIGDGFLREVPRDGSV